MDVLFTFIWALGILIWFGFLIFQAGKQSGRREKVETIVDYVKADQDTFFNAVKGKQRSNIFTENKDN